MHLLWYLVDFCYILHPGIQTFQKEDMIPDQYHTAMLQPGFTQTNLNSNSEAEHCHTARQSILYPLRVISLNPVWSTFIFHLIARVLLGPV